MSRRDVHVILAVPYGTCHPERDTAPCYRVAPTMALLLAYGVNKVYTEMASIYRAYPSLGKIHVHSLTTDLLREETSVDFNLPAARKTQWRVKLDRLLWNIPRQDIVLFIQILSFADKKDRAAEGRWLYFVNTPTSPNALVDVHEKNISYSLYRKYMDSLSWRVSVFSGKPEVYDLTSQARLHRANAAFTMVLSESLSESAMEHVASLFVDWFVMDALFIYFQ
jgi:hypothetical protein